MYLQLNKQDTESIKKIIILKESSQEETNLEIKHLLQDIAMELWTLFSTDIRKIKSATTIGITIDNTLPQYSLRSDALADINTIIQDYLKGKHKIPCTNPCNYLIHPEINLVEKDEDLYKISELPIKCCTQTLVVPKLYTLLSVIPGDCQ